MKLLILNGPNLNLIGQREPEIYGRKSFEEYFENLQMEYPGVTLHYFQSNHEGDLIDKIQEAGFSYQGVILNAGAYSHTSIALADAISAIETPVVEVHISNIYAREDFRQKSLTANRCDGCITGLGLKGYALAIEYFID
ncbi:MAG: type II 3-dehydroquinate dehydratase [Saprospiraceae bacterium]|nr:type II 3-dehydroquinate dehydratase [Saprospiraceae bacterium]